MMNVILLAAGFSKRFGSNKLLHCIDGTPMYRYAVEAAKEFQERFMEPLQKPGKGEAVRLIAVTAYEEIGRELCSHDGFIPYGDPAGCIKPAECIEPAGYNASAGHIKPDRRVVFNRNREMGISHSIALGIWAAGAVSEEDGLMFMVCDQPWLAAGEIFRLAEEFRRTNKTIACLSDGGRAGNPVVFSGRYREELLSLRGDTGGKAVIKRHPGEVYLCPASNPAALEDIDYIDNDIDREEDE
ncbi:nucleotidyltransferase family protein [[Clostridium] symbiosum]|uniref:nucleotidyltransferase family protein n=1 Tax=Clostridium symbiosum TaxID=1512 RepID=UPI001D080FAF|nr:nucleotidyltransferase family protein [[Clostridium] symbiosum]MCB6610414.1 nucleotidyltransferase family protein [[Clostridium] symbiosum]MCB6933442.1 nucleotidyltransferase family protein [[Clostridium] symbiosum]